MYSLLTDDRGRDRCHAPASDKRRLQNIFVRGLLCATISVAGLNEADLKIKQIKAVMLFLWLIYGLMALDSIALY